MDVSMEFMWGCHKPTMTHKNDDLGGDLLLTLPHYLVGGLEHFVFFHIVGISSSQLTFIFFRGVGIPPTSYAIFSFKNCEMM
jgi:hypothetical protein